MITKSALQHLTDSRSKATMDLHYSIGGEIEKQVRHELEKMRQQQLKCGIEKLQQADDKFRYAQAFKTREGLAKAQFNTHTQSPDMG